jgi:hypothetical protein
VATQEPQPTADTMREKSLETVQVVEKKMKPYEELFLKCKDDWIHHLAQALAFSFLTTLVSIAYILLPMYSAILGRLDTKTSKCLPGVLKRSFHHHSHCR